MTKIVCPSCEGADELRVSTEKGHEDCENVEKWCS